MLSFSVCMNIRSILPFGADFKDSSREILPYDVDSIIRPCVLFMPQFRDFCMAVKTAQVWCNHC